ncbi:MAG: hypothetical protein LBB34_03320 [Holosporales bacterium]|jgi:hypothetical protein|nr:hypothetical protein [Holosporales bacterium]
MKKMCKALLMVMMLMFGAGTQEIFGAETGHFHHWMPKHSRLYAHYLARCIANRNEGPRCQTVAVDVLGRFAWGALHAQPGADIPRLDLSVYDHQYKLERLLHPICRLMIWKLRVILDETIRDGIVLKNFDNVLRTAHDWLKSNTINPFADQQGQVDKAFQVGFGLLQMVDVTGFMYEELLFQHWIPEEIRKRWQERGRRGGCFGSHCKGGWHNSRFDADKDRMDGAQSELVKDVALRPSQELHDEDSAASDDYGQRLQTADLNVDVTFEEPSLLGRRPRCEFHPMGGGGMRPPGPWPLGPHGHRGGGRRFSHENPESVEETDSAHPDDGGGKRHHGGHRGGFRPIGGMGMMHQGPWFGGPHGHRGGGHWQ